MWSWPCTHGMYTFDHKRTKSSFPGRFAKIAKSQEMQSVLNTSNNYISVQQHIQCWIVLNGTIVECFRITDAKHCIKVLRHVMWTSLTGLQENGWKFCGLPAMTEGPPGIENWNSNSLLFFMAPNCCYSAIISADIWPDAFRERVKFMFNNQTLSDVTFAVQASQSHNNETEPCSSPTIYIQAHKSFADD